MAKQKKWVVDYGEFSLAGRLHKKRCFHLSRAQCDTRRATKKELKTLQLCKACHRR